MKYSLLKKSVLTVASLTTLFSASAFAADQNFERAQKELKIMTKIFETSLDDSKQSRTRFLSSQETSATYLAKQGMVFSFNFGRNSFQSAGDWAAFGEGVGNLVGEIASEVGNAFIEAPTAPEAVVDLEDYFSVYQDRIEAQEAMREKLSEQREQVREMQREIRRAEREQREAEREKRTVENLKRDLEKKLSKLEKKKDEYNKMMKEYREKRDQKYLANSKKKSEAILTTLCDYGATLKSLNKDEYVTIIFKNYVDDKDQVYVFENRDVKSCGSTKELLNSAISYQM